MGKFITIELQTLSDGRVALLNWTFESIPEAAAKYYTLLAVAALSTVPIHTVMIIDQFGTSLCSKSYTHSEPIEAEETLDV